MKNRIKGVLFLYGIALPASSETKQWSGRFLQWVKPVEFSSPPANEYLRVCLTELAEHRQRLPDMTRLLRTYCRQEPPRDPMRWLMSVPGSGFTTAVTVYTELMRMSRFPNLDTLAAYVGLVPSMTGSGEQATNHGLTRRQHRDLRTLLIEAAWGAVRHDPALLQTFLELSRRMKTSQAIVRIAKKLLSRLRDVWMHHTCYRIQGEELKTTEHDQ